MQAPLSRWLSQQSAEVATATDRDELLARGLNLVRGTALVPTPYGRSSLDQFVCGHLTIG
jgi:hypothetical protein